MTPLDLEIRSRLSDYLGRKTRLKDFQQWFTPQAWNIEKRADAATASLVREIDLLLAEFAHGDWTEAEFVEKLRPFVTKYTFRIGEPTIAMSSVTEILQIGLRQDSGADIRLVKEFA
jgi:hypothetical protein